MKYVLLGLEQCIAVLSTCSVFGLALNDGMNLSDGLALKADLFLDKIRVLNLSGLGRRSGSEHWSYSEHMLTFAGFGFKHWSGSVVVRR